MRILSIGILLVAGCTATSVRNSGRVDPNRLSPPSQGNEVVLDHGPWTRFLEKNVFYAGRATERLFPLRQSERLRYDQLDRAVDNPRPSRFDNNRIYISKFGDEHRIFVAGYRAGLERAHGLLPKMSKDEQLAYWLNLYNARVIEWLASVYPKRLVDRDEDGSPWMEAALKVSGSEISLRDIEAVLFAQWQEPLVLYGLFQGTVGGPRLPRRAYRGEDVWDQLESNAYEFINSNRGMRPSEQTLEVSQVYEWSRPMWADDAALRTHILKFAQPPFLDGVEETSTLVRDLYDPMIADLRGGNMRVSSAKRSYAQEGRAWLEFGFQGEINQDRTLPDPRIPASVRNTVTGMLKHNNRNPRVEIRDCGPDDECPEAPVDKDR